MSSTDFRQLSTKELHLYMNLVMGFCSDMRRLLREGKLTADAIDKYEMTAVNILIAEVNYRSQAAPERRSDRTPQHSPRPER